MHRIIALALLALAPPGSTLGQEQPEAGQATVVASKEYFVQQGADEAIVVRVSAFEAEFESRLSTGEGDKLSESSLPDARMLPLYQFVAEPGKPRQVDIDVAATQVTDRTEFELELTRLNVRDERSARVANAYRFLTLGLESLTGGNVPDWTVKVQALLRAEGLFAEIGMEELRLWCRVYAAHLVLHRLRDLQTARDWAEESLTSPRIDRFDTIAFAASKIRSSALAASAPAADGGDPMASPLQRALEDTALRARSLDYRFEEALSLQASAVDLKAKGLPAPALERLNRALAIAQDIAAADLATTVREHIVEIHEEFGDIEASGAVLQDIETHLLTTGESEELARNLLQQGRLYLASYRYAEAVEALSRAAELEQSALSRIEVELALGSALNEAGRFEEALVHLYRAVVQPDSGDLRKPGPGFDLFAALGDIAAIHRQQEDFERLARIRDAQEGYARGESQRSEWAYRRAVDALLDRGASWDGVRERFDAAHRQAEASGEGAWRVLSLLRLCALPGVLNGNDPRCSDGAVGRADEQARAAGSARQAAESAMLYSRLLGLRGQTARALAAAEAQVDELLASGHAPLGSWYWQWRGPLFENYLGLAIEAEGGADAASSLLALARARLVERGGRGTPAAGATTLQAFLASLPRDSAVLGYFLAESEAQAWIARRSGVRRISLDNPGRILALCSDMRRVLQSGNGGAFPALAAQLGALLLDPVSGLLPGTIYLLSHGVLLGIPVDALTAGGEPLATRHRVIHLVTFPAAPDPSNRLRLERPASVFLAGDPRAWSGDYAVRLDPSPEVRAVTDRFVGPGLNAVQGVALLVDEFEDDRFRLADLVHLSVPGMVDLSPARDSALFLSEPARGLGRQQLTAAALGEMPLHAALVFLSRTEFSGSGSMVESDLGLVTSALEAGAGAVIASLWPVEDEARGRFVSAFYTHLEESHDAAAALALAKRDAMREGNARDWASFQLFLD